MRIARVMIRPQMAVALWAAVAGLLPLLAAGPAQAGIVTSAGGNYGIARSMMPRGDAPGDYGPAPAQRRHKPYSGHHHHGGKTHKHPSHS